VIIAVIPMHLLLSSPHVSQRWSYVVFLSFYPSRSPCYYLGVLCEKRRASLSRPTGAAGVRLPVWLWLTLMRRQWSCPLRNSSKSYAHGDSHRSHGAMHGRRPAECTVLTQRFALVCSHACSSRVDIHACFSFGLGIPNSNLPYYITL
jgi:hypothetical protein